MEPTQIQLVFNVVMITGVTSLGGYCYLLKKEYGKLGAQRAIQADVPPPAENREQVVELDVRTLASAHRTRWVKAASSITQAD